MAYRTKKGPQAEDKDLQATVFWAEDEFQAIERSQTDDIIALELRSTGREPDKPREGMIVYADGENWDPNSSSGPYYYNGTLWVPMRGREQYTADRQYFVRDDGSNSNTGTTNTAGGAWRNVNYGLSQIRKHDLNGFNAELKTGGTTFSDTTPVVVSSEFLGGTVTLMGDVTTPSNAAITTTAANAVTLRNAAVLQIAGFKLSTVGSGLTSGLDVQRFAVGLITGNCEFAACTGDHAQAANGGYIEFQANYRIVGNAGFAHWAARNAGTLTCEGRIITLSGTPSFGASGAGFADATVNGNQRVGGNTFSGSATGRRFRVLSEGVLFTNFVSANAYFPGNVAGGTDNTGYVIQ